MNASAQPECFRPFRIEVSQESVDDCMIVWLAPVGRNRCLALPGNVA
jgi:hypothetical protein